LVRILTPLEPFQYLRHAPTLDHVDIENVVIIMSHIELLSRACPAPEEGAKLSEVLSADVELLSAGLGVQL
jgi:hypothetical protein